MKEGGGGRNLLRKGGEKLEEGVGGGVSGGVEGEGLRIRDWGSTAARQVKRVAGSAASVRTSKQVKVAAPLLCAARPVSRTGAGGGDREEWRMRKPGLKGDGTDAAPVVARCDRSCRRCDRSCCDYGHSRQLRSRGAFA